MTWDFLEGFRAGEKPSRHLYANPGGEWLRGYYLRRRVEYRKKMAQGYQLSYTQACCWKIPTSELSTLKLPPYIRKIKVR